MNRPTPKTFTSGHRQLVYNTTRWQRILTEGRSRRGVFGEGIAAAAVAKFRVEEGVSGEASYPSGAVREKCDADMLDLATEIFARAYDGPERLDEVSGDMNIAETVHDIIGDMPEWKSLCAQVEGDPDFSAMAAGEVLKTVAEKMPEIIKAVKDREEAEDGEDGKAGAPGTGQGNAPGLPGAEDMARAAIRKAMRTAKQKVDDGRQALAGIAPGLESAPPTHLQESTGRMDLAERLLQDDRLRGVLKKAGRISRLASSAKRRRTTQARSEVVDTERGNDIARMLPSALVRLRHPLLRKLALRDIVESTAPQYRLEGKETLGRGPIVIAIDRSGSMGGEPEEWASAAAIALCSQASKERRAVTTIEFTYGPDTMMHLDERGNAELQEWNPYQRSIKTVKKLDGLKDIAMSLATRYSNGGTSFDAVMKASLDAGLKDDRADFIFITDGQASISDQTLEELRAAKEKGLRVFALTLNGGSTSEAIRDLADISIDLDRSTDIAAEIAKAQAAASKLAS